MGDTVGGAVGGLYIIVSPLTYLTACHGDHSTQGTTVGAEMISHWLS